MDLIKKSLLIADTVFNKHDAEAIIANDYIVEDYIQHNPIIPDGRNGFVDNIFPLFKRDNVSFENLRIFQDGNYVIAHNHIKNTQAFPFGGNEIVTMDIWRCNEDGNWVEHWDAVMPITPPNPSGRTLLDGPTQVEDLELTEHNRKFMTDFLNLLSGASPEELAAKITDYFDFNYRQYNPNAGDGIEGFAKAMQSGRLDFKFTKLHKVFAQGNFVLGVSEGLHKGNPAIFYDLVRIENGKIVDHWDVIQDIPAESANNNSMFNFKEETVPVA